MAADVTNDPLEDGQQSEVGQIAISIDRTASTVILRLPIDEDESVAMTLSLSQVELLQQGLRLAMERLTSQP